MRVAPACICPITAALANPSSRNNDSTAATACGAQVTSNPPLVCGSQERLLPGRETVRQPYVIAVTCPVARGGAGVVTLLRERQRRREDRQRLERDARAEPRAAADLGEMAEQTEAGDIGHRVHPRDLRQPMADGVELRGAGQHLPVSLLR